MEDKVTPIALEVDIVSSALEVAHHTSFEVEYTSSFEAEYIFSTSPDSEFEITSSGTEVEQTSSGLNIKITLLSFTCIEFTSLISTSQRAKITSTSTYQQSEVASHSYTYQSSKATSSSNYQHNLQEEDTFDDWESADRLEDESQHNKLVDLKAHYAMSGLPHVSSQFFTSIDAILVQFLTSLVLLWQQFQVSQSLTYEGCIASSAEVSGFNTVNDAFIEDINDEPQTTLKSLLNGVEISNVIELWRIRRIGGLSYRENLVILLSDGTHLCTCMEMITKGIICRHFWHVMLYTSHAKFHISIIPARWYKDNIMNQLDTYLKRSPVLTAIRPSTETLPLSSEAMLTFQSLRQF
ncbi:protein far1-related sequence 5-like [Gigaspora margarita]|uniref:Protein far1-related sequence 5-like n=1 Tax=Gigaspora margarita TaxID=4874 RepID=A0A8H4A8E1_GIGMA|nr:protein far1-related sequence 5-like [Gigaspora margarita]